MLHADERTPMKMLPFQNAKKDSAECRKLLPLKLQDAKL